MVNEELNLMAHLMRRAGFGATREELEVLVEKGYEATLEELLDPQAEEPAHRDEFLRYHPGFWKPITSPGMGSAPWLHDLINSGHVLEEKIALFWHQVFATGQSKIDHWHEIMRQVDMFREKGMGDYRALLVELARNPAMIFWLDNCDNHAYAVNENWGRELLELFSMGVDNYTEDDVRDCSRAFTGWTLAPTIPRNAHGRHDWGFEYRDEDHDDGEKTFLGHTGQFNGEEIIDIVCQQDATARFIARHLYNFFVADETQVPSWSNTTPIDPDAIDTLAKAFQEHHYDIRSVLRVLFNSDFFKNAQFAKIKSPAELVVGTLRLVGGFEFPSPGIGNLSKEPGYMGQELLNPPSVEGWHTGPEWINSGALMKRINFTADMVGDVTKPGVSAIVGRVKAQGDLSSENFVDACLDLMGPMEVTDDTRRELVEHASESGTLSWGANSDEVSAERVGEMLQLIVSTREYQYT